MSDYRPNIVLLIWVVLIGILLPLTYLLSIGPVYWLMAQGYLTPIAESIYYPLTLLAKYCPPFGDAIDWYISLFQ